MSVDEAKASLAETDKFGKDLESAKEELKSLQERLNSFSTLSEEVLRNESCALDGAVSTLERRISSQNREVLGEFTSLEADLLELRRRQREKERDNAHFLPSNLGRFFSLGLKERLRDSQSRSLALILLIYIIFSLARRITHR
mmetsp:Transcript_13804/g.16724  ORF Transcript_13804/g.16724 Transcript_13804/m.16724 type:complete len:143 (+) Transcript_13804:121-549(+)